MLTDSAAVTTRVAHASASSNMHTPDESRLGCMSHPQKNAMNHSMANSHGDSLHQVEAADFRSMKRILEDSNRYGWNQYLRDE